MKSADATVLDKAAIGLSAACLVQCLALPVSFLLLPALSISLSMHALFHLTLLVVALPLSLAAFGLGWRRHRSRHVVVLGGIGLMALITAATLGHDILGVTGEVLLTSAGGVLLIWAHVLNLMHSRSASTPT